MQAQWPEWTSQIGEGLLHEGALSRWVILREASA